MTSSVSPPPEIDAGDDWLDDLLRDAGREHRADYVVDDGFTKRVMARLPESVALPAWRRPAVVLLWTLGVGALVFSLPGMFEQVFHGAVAVLAGHRLGLPDVAMLLLVFGAATWSILVYAVRAD